MIIRGPVRPDVDPELATIDPVAASEWFGFVPNVQVPQASVLTAAVWARRATQLADIIEAVDGDRRWGWLTVRSELLKTLTGSRVGDSLPQQVEERLRLKGVRIIGVPSGLDQGVR
jgi:hypothetical protein